MTPGEMKTQRLNAGLSQRALAAECDVSLTTIQRLEDGKAATPANAKKVADYFGITVTELFGLERAA